MGLDFYQGKICTILTSPVPRSFNEKQFVDHFTGIVSEITEEGIEIKHPETGDRTFFFRDKIVAIVQEHVLDPENPSDAQFIQELTGQITEIDEPESTSPFIDVDALAKLKKST